jgi:hypothetical protein
MRRLPLLLPQSLAALTLLAACGDNGAGTVSASGGGSTGAGTDTSTSTTNGSNTATQGTTEDPTQGGTMGQTDSATTGPGTTTTTTSPTTTSESTSTTQETTDTTQGVDTQTTGEPGTSTTTTTTTDTTEGSTSTTEGSSGTTVADTTGGPEPCACPDIEVPLDDGIFVLSDNSELWKFRPDDNSFAMLGAFNCNGNTSTFSMAVDRLGFAWVMVNSPQGDIYKVDVTNPQNCIDPGYNPGQMGVGYFGMAFVSNSQFDQCDSLYGNTFNGVGGFSEGPNIGDFLNLDPNTLQITKISKSNFNGAEMTGTGDGRVFSFGGVPSKLIERDKANGNVISTFPLNNLPLTNAFAFSFFAGDFYFFTESNLNPLFSSKVTHLDYDDSDMDGQQQLTTVVMNAPIRIVGAGVSTCAPFIPM